jgi:hypothetical protein
MNSAVGVEGGERSVSTAVRERRGRVLFAAGAVLMVGVTVLGKYFLPELHALGFTRFQATATPPQALKALLFAVGFPLGAGACVLGALLASGASRRRISLSAAAAVTAAFAAAWLPALTGSGHSPAYFGAGGVLIAVLLIAGAWLWARVRGRLDGDARIATDWMAAGYFCFALAAWNLCGVGGMPGFALYPERVIELQTLGFVVGQLKVVMAFFVLGWLFTVVGVWRRAGSSR